MATGTSLLRMAVDVPVADVGTCMRSILDNPDLAVGGAVSYLEFKEQLDKQHIDKQPAVQVSGTGESGQVSGDHLGMEVEVEAPSESGQPKQAPKQVANKKKGNSAKGAKVIRF